MPVYPAGSKRWRVVVFHRGKRHDQIVHGLKKEAQNVEAALRQKVREGEHVARHSVPTFLSYCRSEYATHAKINLRQSTWANRRIHLATLCAHFGGLRLDEITVTDVDAFKDARKADRVSPVTINNELRVFRRVLSFAAEQGYRLPKLRWTYLEEPAREPRALTRLQVRCLLHACRRQSPTIYQMVRALVLTGLRRGEAMALPMAHVDLDRREIKIATVHEGGRVIWLSKTNKVRVIPVPVELEPYLQQRAASGGRWAFPSRQERRRVSWPKNQWAAAVQRANRLLARLGEEPIQGGPHRLRHTYATWFLAARPDLPLLARLLGHTVQRTTELYTHAMPEHLDRARDVVRLDPLPGNVVPLKTLPATLPGTDGKKRKPS